MSFVISTICLEFMPKIEGFLQFDVGMFVLLVALYVTGLLWSITIAILHGFSTMMISGTIVGAFSNSITGVMLILFWFAISILLFHKNKTQIKTESEISIIAESSKKIIWQDIIKIILISIVTILAVTCCDVLSNKYFLLHLYGADSLANNNHYLWYILFWFNFVNILINIIIFIVIMPIVLSILKLKH